MINLVQTFVTMSNTNDLYRGLTGNVNRSRPIAPGVKNLPSYVLNVFASSIYPTMYTEVVITI